jgi:hypothetical protein
LHENEKNVKSSNLPASQGIRDPGEESESEASMCKNENFLKDNKHEARDEEIEKCVE